MANRSIRDSEPFAELGVQCAHWMCELAQPGSMLALIGTAAPLTYSSANDSAIKTFRASHIVTV